MFILKPYRSRPKSLTPRQPCDDLVVDSDDGRCHARFAGFGPAEVAGGAAIGEEIKIGCAHRSVRQHDGGASSARGLRAFFDDRSTAAAQPRFHQLWGTMMRQRVSGFSPDTSSATISILNSFK